MVVLSKAVWVKTFGFKEALFPYDNPALFSMTIAFVGIWLFSQDRRQPARARGEQAAFEAQYVRSETGIGAAAAACPLSPHLDRRRDGGRSRPATDMPSGFDAPTRPSTA